MHTIIPIDGHAWTTWILLCPAPVGAWSFPTSGIHRRSEVRGRLFGAMLFGGEKETMDSIRSLLFVPADSAKKLEKAMTSGADALIVDLENFDRAR